MSRRPLPILVAASILCWFLLSLALAQPAAGKKYALLVGINRYEHDKLQPLSFAEADVEELAAVLKGSGYTVTLLTPSASDRSLKPTRENIETQLKSVLRGCKKGDTVVVGFAGHGMQFEKQKETDPEDAYFCPVDARPFRDERATMVSLSGVYTELDKSFAGMKVLLVDACRNDPDAVRGRSGGVTADSVRPPQGAAALFSCRAGERAFEHESLKHGVFFHHVLEGLKGKAKDGDGEVTFAGLAAYVSRRVSREVPGLIGGDARQSPNLKADYSIEPVLVTVADGIQTPPAPAEEKTYVSKTTGMKFVRIKAGTFTMGSPKSEKDRSDDETEHEVTLSKDFYLSVYEVTQKEWRTVMGTTPWQGKDYVKEGDDYPATYVSWNDAVEYAKKLGEKDGMAYRLPTEAEWEYACRAGNRSSYSFGDSPESLFDHGWFVKNAWAAGEKYAQRVGQKKSNKLGLCDMHGNVWEWCSDRYGDYPSGRVTDPTGPTTGSDRVNRGGGWLSNAWGCRSADRSGNAPSNRLSILGFRLSLVPSGR